MAKQLPLIYFYGVAPGIYEPLFPAFVVDWNPEKLSCGLSFSAELADLGHWEAPTATERRYALRTIQQRLHQALFRAHVLAAYGSRCALSRDQPLGCGVALRNGIGIAMAQRRDPAHAKERTELLGVRLTAALKTRVKVEAARRGLTIAQLFEEMCLTAKRASASVAPGTKCGTLSSLHAAPPAHAACTSRPLRC
jgi:hypothetical protein